MKRLCKMCHKPSGERPLCKTCERAKRHHDAIDEARVQKLRDAGWVPEEVKPIRTRQQPM